MNRAYYTLPFYLLTLLFTLPLSSANTQTVTENDYHRVFYLIQSGQTDAALNLYYQYTQHQGSHNFEVIQQFALHTLEEGAYSSDPESQLLAIFGAGVSMNEKTIPILEAGLKKPQPQIQLVSLNCLAHLNSDEADQIINRAIASNSALTRYVGICHLAEKKMPSAVGQAEALMCKVDKTFLPLFPEIYATIGSKEAMRSLRKLLSDNDEKVRIAAIASVMKHDRDDMLPTIRILASHQSPAQQEACAAALGHFKDHSSLKKLETMSVCHTATTRLAALHALYLMGQEERKQEIEKLALKGDLYAITLLSKIPGTEETLIELVKSNQLQIRINALFALLQHRDPRVVPYLPELLIEDARDLAFSKTFSPGNAFSAYKVIPSAQQRLKEDDSIEKELSLTIKENALEKAADLPSAEYIKIAQLIFQSRQNRLVPKLVECLEALHTEEAIALLKRYQQEVGAPLIRNYCNLSLYRLKEEGNYDKNLYDWIASQHNVDIISFRPLLPWEKKEKETPFQLTPQETSRLLIESFEAVASSQDDRGVIVLLDAIQNGNKKNKYALAGLLIRAAQ